MNYSLTDRFMIAYYRSATPTIDYGVAPPGSGGITKIVNWLAWAAVVICIAGVIIAGVGLIFGGRGGHGNENASKLGWALAGSIVVGSAAALVAGVTATT